MASILALDYHLLSAATDLPPFANCIHCYQFLAKPQGDPAALREADERGLG